MTERDWEAAARKRLETTVASAVKRLRDTADQIEREAARNIETIGQFEWSTYGRVAGQLVHEVVSGVSNANLANVIDAASDADAARIEKAGYPS